MKPLAWVLLAAAAACSPSSASSTSADAGRVKHDGSTAQCVPGEIQPDPTPMGCEGCAIAVSLAGVVLGAGVVVCAADGGQWAGRYEYADGCSCGKGDASRGDAAKDATGDGAGGSDAALGSDGGLGAD